MDISPQKLNPATHHRIKDHNSGYKPGIPLGPFSYICSLITGRGRWPPVRGTKSKVVSYWLDDNLNTPDK